MPKFNIHLTFAMVWYVKILIFNIYDRLVMDNKSFVYRV